MSFRVTTQERTGKERVAVRVLEGGGGVAEVCPALGFNCFRWSAGGTELLYCDPGFFTDGRPTRSGIPVLFPFPNRIRAGRFTWDGKDYQLPLNDSTSKNAIHGFACRKPWRVVDEGADGSSAWVTGEFQCSLDAPESRPFWPADHRIRITYRLQVNRLRVEALVENPGPVALPFGLGYHPYFLASADDPVQAPARSYWQLEESLPTGKRLPVDAARDLTAPRRCADLQLDDGLTDLDEKRAPGAGVLLFRGRVHRLWLHASRDFRELVAFTPPHRQAVCLEPYTCPTDAINLHQRGTDPGLLVLPPGGRWEGVVEMVLA
jgi:aldose 1-epimerase